MVDLSNYHLVFDDEFNGTSLDMTKWNVWTTEHPAFPDDQPTASDVTVSNGELHLEANLGGTTDGRPYSTAIVDTQNKFDFQYRYAEASIEAPDAKGMWPAFWTFPQDGQWTHEIDIMEMFMADKYTNHMSLHFPQNGVDQYVTQAFTGPDFSAGFHTFGVMWTPTTLTWYVDGTAEFSVANNIPTEDMYLILSEDTDQVRPWNSVDSTTPFPNYLNVDYVRVYQINGPPSPPPPEVTISAIVSATGLKAHPQFTISVDGQQVQGPVNITASYQGKTQTISFQEALAAGPHTIEIDFSHAAPRPASTLYVDQVTVGATNYLQAPDALHLGGKFDLTVQS
jgi:beta-glucanase (GH16 family)